MKTLATSLLLLFLIGSQASAQHSSNAYRVLADSLYRHHHYQYATEYYEKALRKAPEPGYLMLQLGKCYDKINNAPAAERWFKLASKNKAVFTDEDYYLFAESLIAQEKRQQADSVLEKILSANPNMHLASQALWDIRNYDRFFEDSSLYKIKSLSINSDVAEFSPVYYKDGLVFSAARQESALKKKYHWDNSHYLNLYYSAKKDDVFTSPELFEKDLSTKHHDGPAMFYANYQRMILNRNQRIRVEGREDVYELRPGLFEALFNPGKSTWDVTPLPFNNTAFSYAHPSISEDGNTLYFASDMPGGYGGNDIYRVERVNGVWGIPFNLGPIVNTLEDEAFPFFINNTLYFASTGHGGLGGLDIFVTHVDANGFTPVRNLGYPINSHADDFSLITDSVKSDGYYSSSRNGNDDIFSFRKIDPKVILYAHIFDGESKTSLPGANIQVITNGGDDRTLISDERGEFTFSLPRDAAFIVIGTKDDLIGMTSDVADSTGKKIEIAAYRDTTSVLCIGLVKNEDGIPQKASVIEVTDLITSQKLSHPSDESIITFRGEKGHHYRVEVQDITGHTAEHQLDIAPTDHGTKRFTIILPSGLEKMEMAAKVYRADDNQPLANAQVQLITFNDHDREMITNSSGIVEFALDHGTAYVVIATKDGMSGMHSGMAEEGMDKRNIIHPVPVYGDRHGNVLAMGLVTSRTGQPVEGYTAEVTNKATGEKIAIHADKGLLTFFTDRGASYNINVMHDEFETAKQELHIPGTGSDVEKFAIILDKRSGEEKILPVSTPVIAQNIKPSTLLLVETEDGKSKAFVANENSMNEITEKNGQLYLENSKTGESIGKGSIADLKNDRSTLTDKNLAGLGSVTLRNIYFDFDKATLDDDDKQRLHLVKQVLDNYNAYTLTIAGHADDRGTDNYNVRLSRKRSNAVARYLIEQGVPKSRINQRALGETQPAIPCTTDDCSEEDHKLNRRAEFVISQEDSQADPLVSLGDQKNTSTFNSGTYDELIQDFGERQVDGISFKVNIGAFKKSHDLKFKELADLGKIESFSKEGMTYYSLSEYRTLKEAEEIRQRAEKRGVKGASITIYYNGDRIRLAEFVNLTQK